MVCSTSSNVGVAMLLAFAAVSRPAAQVTTVIAAAGYQAPGLIAPAAFVSSSVASGASVWTAGLSGFTLSTDLAKQATPTLAAVVGIELTPIDANSSRYVYRDGQRDPRLEFRDRTVRLNAGLRLQDGSRWRLDVRAIGLYESVGGVADSAVLARWRTPYVGWGVETSYRRVVSEDILEARWDGLKVAGSAVAFTGSRPWWKSQLSAGAGKQLGRVMVWGRAWVLLGDNLDVVNQHVVGGCWDLAGSPSLYGYHYAEFRVDRAGIFGGGVDVRLAGEWELGLRLGYLNSPSRTTYGEAVRLRAIWNGIGFHVGVGFPRGALFSRETEQPLVFAGLSAGVL